MHALQFIIYLINNKYNTLQDIRDLICQMKSCDWYDCYMFGMDVEVCKSF